MTLQMQTDAGQIHQLFEARSDVKVGRAERFNRNTASTISEASLKMGASRRLRAEDSIVASPRGLQTTDVNVSTRPTTVQTWPIELEV